MTSNVLSHFSCLDELIQVIYQSAERFVVMSNVDHEKWSIYLGLSGLEGRWWHGAWAEADILQAVGLKSSGKILESFAEKLAEAFVQGELYVGKWNTEKGTNINLTIGPTSKQPMQIPLTEISAKEAASHAAEVFLSIALQAQSRKCRLYPPGVDNSTLSLSLTPMAAETKRRLAPVSLPSHTEQSTATSKVSKTSEVLESKQSEETNKKPAARSGKSGSSAPVIPKTRKGASLANPNKKARKYKEIEFASDDE